MTHKTCILWTMWSKGGETTALDEWHSQLWYERWWQCIGNGGCLAQYLGVIMQSIQMQQFNKLKLELVAIQKMLMHSFVSSLFVFCCSCIQCVSFYDSSSQKNFGFIASHTTHHRIKVLVVDVILHNFFISSEWTRFCVCLEGVKCNIFYSLCHTATLK